MCKYWLKRYLVGKISIECEDRVVKEEEGSFQPNLELSNYEKIRYSNPMDSEIIVIYAKPDP